MSARYCERPGCGTLLEQKRYPCGVLETSRNFAKRRFCSTHCSNGDPARKRYCGGAREPRHGPNHPHWKGDTARSTTKRRRAQKAYPLAECEICDAPATDRHHRDGDTGNNHPRNIQRLCRRCHMRKDGRMERFVAAGEQARRRERRIVECLNCGRVARPSRRGRCGTCNEYFRTHGTERPENLFNRPTCQRGAVAG